MPAPSGFSGQNLADCASCPPDGRLFRTARVCGECGKPLCLNCRAEVPGRPLRCPDCGGGTVENGLRDPAEAIRRIQADGAKPPYWLNILAQRNSTASINTVEETVIPE